jgi:ATP-binding cassette subfamily B multidrug efflux pump
MRRLIKDYLFPYFKLVLLTAFFVFCHVFLQLKLMSMTQTILDNGVKHHNMGLIMGSGLIMVIYTFLLAVAMFSSSYLSAHITASLVCDIREDMFKKINSLSPVDYRKFSISSLMTRATSDASIVQSFMINFLRDCLLIPFVLIGIIVAISLINLELASILIVCFITTVTLMIVYSKQSIMIFSRVQEILDYLNLLLKEKILGARSIRAFGKQSYETKKFEKYNLESYEGSLKAANKIYFLTPLALIIMNLAIVLVYYFGSLKLQAGIIKVSDLILFFQYSTFFIGSLGLIPFIVNTIPKFIVSSGRIEEVLYYDTKLDNNPKLTKPNKGTVEFENVNFSYNPGRNVLTNINFKAPVGTVTAFIGSTGSGKTSIINLLTRFYDPNYGKILIDGEDIKNIDITGLRSSISLSSQEVMILNDTVKNNILMGENLSEEKIEEICNISSFDEVINKLPKGLNTNMSQSGMNISGGEKQRLNIARTLAKNAEIYIFDDSFSSLDNKNEKIISEKIFKQLNDKTIFLVSQKISNIINADNIIVLDKGTIESQGTHEELLKSSPIYKEIYQTQIMFKEGESLGK